MQAMSMSALWSVTFSLDSASSIHIAARPSSRTSFSVCCVIGGSSPTRRCRLWLIHTRLWSTHSGNICRKSGGCQYRFSAITHVSRISSFGSDSAAVPLSCLRCLPPMSRDSFDATLTSAAPVAPNTSSVHYEPSCDTCDTAARLRQDLAACVPTVANWSLSTLPKFLQPGQVQQVLDHCDRHSAVGLRNYAILVLLARS